MKKLILILLILILLAVFAFSGWQVYKIWNEYRVGEKTYASLETYVVMPETTAPTESVQTESQPAQSPSEPVEEVPVEEAGIRWPQVDFAALQEINPDVVGWIYIEGTQVNYPIVQGKNNDKYLYRMITGEYNSAGSLFLDAEVERDFSDRNNAVYGHNMKNGSMFAGIMGYKGQEFYQEHPVILLLTPDRNYQVHIFSAYVLSAHGDAWDTSFSDESFGKWLDRRISRSYIETDVVPTAQDRVLTLSTCTYENRNSRFLVHGILVPEEES